MNASKTREALAGRDLFIEWTDDGLTISLDTLVNDGSGDECAFDDGDDDWVGHDYVGDAHDAHEEGEVRAVWGAILADAVRRLTTALGHDVQLTLDGIEPPPPPTFPPFTDEYDGPGAIDTTVTFPLPSTSAEDHALALAILSLLGALDAFEDERDGVKRRADAAKVAAENLAAREQREAIRARTEHEIEAYTVLVRIDHRETWNRFGGASGILGRRVVERWSTEETAKGHVIGVSPSEWREIEGWRKSKRVCCTRLRTKARRSWIPRVTTQHL